MDNTIKELAELIKERREKSPDKSYVSKLINKKGRKKIAQKVGEEAVELAIAAVAEKKKHVVSESADLLFHMMVLWEELGVSYEDVAAELQSRMGMSGLDEKAARKSE